MDELFEKARLVGQQLERAGAAACLIVGGYVREPLTYDERPADRGIFHETTL